MKARRRRKFFNSICHSRTQINNEKLNEIEIRSYKSPPQAKFFLDQRLMHIMCTLYSIIAGARFPWFDIFQNLLVGQEDTFAPASFSLRGRSPPSPPHNLHPCLRLWVWIDGGGSK